MIMYANTSCTLYLKSNGYKKVFIDECFLTKTSIASMNKQGRTYDESAFCMFDGHTDSQFTNGKDLLIEGNCAIEIDITDARKQSESMDRLVKAGAFTIMLADYKKYGTQSMQHWELSCKSLSRYTSKKLSSC